MEPAVDGGLTWNEFLILFVTAGTPILYLVIKVTRIDTTVGFLKEEFEKWKERHEPDRPSQS